MCGIAGIFRKSAEHFPFSAREKVFQMLHRRGPEANGFYEDDTCLLIHTRLGIIAPGAEAAQPFTDISGRWKIIFNGEILNYRELRAELVQNGIEFRTHSDTEVLLQGYLAGGIDFLTKLRGFFAFVILDTVEHTLFLARDHVGIKPLFIAENKDAWFFASTTDVLFELGFSAEADLISLNAFLEFHFIPPERSMWNGIRPVPAGTWIRIHQNEISQGTWKNLSKSNPVSLNGKSVLNILQTAVRRNLVSDVPAGLFLSGGLDSSMIGELAFRQGYSSMTVFSLGFENTYLDESLSAENFSIQKGWKFQRVFLENNTAEKWLEIMPEPVADTAAIGIFRLSEVASDSVKLVLSGDGADEVFGGYDRYYAWVIANTLLGSMNLPKFNLPDIYQDRESAGSNTFRKLFRFIRLLQEKPANRYRFLCGFRNRSEIKNMTLNTEEYQLPLNEIFDRNTLNSILTADRQFILPGNMLPKTDLASMANSLEVRIPYLDEDLTVLMAHAQDAQLMGKSLLKSAWAELTGTQFKIQKKGFDLPLQQLFTPALMMRWMDLTEDSFIKHQGIFNPETISQMRKNPIQPEKTWAYLAWQEVWMRNKKHVY